MNIIDLSQELDENTQVFPGDPNLKLLPWSNYAIQGYKSETIFAITHIGTHIDAPSHFNPDGISVKKIPGLSKLGAEYLAELKINLIGIDSPNIDLTTDKEFSAHRIFSIKNIPIIENLINLDKINQESFIFIALPLKLKYSSGSPGRAIALIN